jgi:TP901 family phage tail tape measure protein
LAKTGSIRAGRAFVELFADDSKLVRGLRSAQRKVKAFGAAIARFGSKLATLGSAIAAPLVASAKAFSVMGDAVAKMSKRTGLSVETLSELRYVASQTGTEFSTLENGLRRMQRSIYDAGRGLSTATDALTDLGLTFQDLDGLSPEQQFKLLAEKISQVEDPTKKAAIAMSLFGRTGTNLLPMFAKGAAGIDQLQQQARELGLTMSSEDAKAAEDFTDAMDRLWKTIKMATFNIGAALAPALNKISEFFTDLVVKTSNWIKQNRQLIVNVAKIAAITIACGLALITLGGIISGLGSIIGVVVTSLTTVGAAFKAVGAIVAFLVSPIGMVVTAITALGGYLVYASGVGGKAIGWLGKRFESLKEDAISAYGGIADAMAAGDLSLAARILWLTLKMEWTRGINFLEKCWLNFRNFFIKIGHDAFYGLLATVQIVWHGLEVGWIETTAFFSKCWQGFVGFFAKSWEKIKAGAKKAWNWIKSLFDESFDLEANNKLVEDQKQAAITKIEDRQQQKIAQRQAKRQQQRESAAKMNEAVLEQIGLEHQKKYDALEDGYNEKMSQNEKDLTEARKAWSEAISTAKDKRKAKESAPETMDGPSKLDSIIAGLESNIADSVSKIGISGTFNATAAFGMGSGSAMDRTAKATEKTAENTDKLVRNSGIQITFG